jgi:hypothetical protein
LIGLLVPFTRVSLIEAVAPLVGPVGVIKATLALDHVYVVAGSEVLVAV